MTSQKVFSNFIWRFLERCGAQLVTFIVSVVLARILDPNVYGITALVTVFTSILNVFLDSGFGNALIQKKEADELDFSSVFYFNVVSSIILYVLLFFFAPFISRFYNMPELIPVVRVLGIGLLISGVKNIQQAYVSRNMLFKKFFFATLGGTIGAAVIGVGMALMGFGVWALVVQGLFNSLVDTIILWITVKWRPKKMFSLTRLKSLFRYGWKLLASALLDTGYSQLYSLIIGKKYTSENLAYYNKGGQFPNVIVTNVNASIDSVLFPTMSSEQEDVERVKQLTRRAIKTSTYIIMPFMMGLAVCATPLVSIVLTDKWLPCVFFMRCYCFSYAFWPLHTANLNAIKALGRSDLFLKLEIIKKLVGIAILIGGMMISVKAMALGMILSSIIGQIINSWPNKKLLGYKYLDQLKDMMPQIILSCVMGAIVYAITFLPIANWGKLIIQIPLGIAIYVLGSKILKIDSFQYVIDIAKKLLGRKKENEH